MERDQPGIVGDDRPRVAGGGVDLRDTAIEQLTGELTADAAVRAGDERGLVSELSPVSSPCAVIIDRLLNSLDYGNTTII